jgi:rod shape-determining protein MreB
VLTGGGGLLRKLDKHLQRETGLKVVVAENPLETVVRGAGQLLGDRELLARVAVA